MDKNKTISHISWLISASKEQMRFLFFDMKSTIERYYLKNDHLLNKSFYHLNLSRTLLNQVEKNYISLIKGGRFYSQILLHLKNTYLQRAIFQLSMGFDYFKEARNNIEKLSFVTYKSLFQTWSQAMMMLNQLIHEVDVLLSMMKE